MMRRIRIKSRSKDHDIRMADLRTEAVIDAIVNHLIR